MGVQQPIDWLQLYLSRLFRLGPLYLLTVACMIWYRFAVPVLNGRIARLIGTRAGTTWLMFTIPG